MAAGSMPWKRRWPRPNAWSEAGADIIDIGGESTRPYAQGCITGRGAAPGPAGDRTTASRIDIPISIDTTKAAVAEAALAAGASMINDISALPWMPNGRLWPPGTNVPGHSHAHEGNAPHHAGQPVYEDLMAEIASFCGKPSARATECGHRGTISSSIRASDSAKPGCTTCRSSGLQMLSSCRPPSWSAPRAKPSFATSWPERPGRAQRADRPEVETGTQAAVAMAVMNGAHIVRVHNVANTRAMVRVLDAIRMHRGGV
jgi:dihydropteroate synthase